MTTMMIVKARVQVKVKMKTTMMMKLKVKAKIRTTTMMKVKAKTQRVKVKMLQQSTEPQGGQTDTTTAVTYVKISLMESVHVILKMMTNIVMTGLIGD